MDRHVPDTPFHERKFTDQEVQEILKKAVQDVGKAAPSSGGLVKSEGLSLSDLKAIGEEVGIDAARLEDAARAVALSDARVSKGVLGCPTNLDIGYRAGYPVLGVRHEHSDTLVRADVRARWR